VSVRIGVIGAGWVSASRHQPAIKRADAAELVAVYDRNPDKTSTKDGNAVWTSDIDELYGLGLDAVSICTPPDSHYDLTIDALGRGVHVFCEKPMAMNIGEAEAMVTAAAEADRLLCVSHNFLWSSAMVKARKAIDAAGQLLYVSATQLSSDNRRLPRWFSDLPGGLLFDEIPHILYIFNDLLGPDLSIDDVRPHWADRISEPQSCSIIMSGSKGTGHVNIVFGAPVSEWHVTSVSERSVVDVDLFRDVMISTGSDGEHKARDVLATSLRVTGGHLLGFAASGARLAMGRQYWGHDTLLASFVDAIESGRPSPVSTQSALAVVRASDQVVNGLVRD